MSKDLSSYSVDPARDLLTDIELSTLQLEQLLLDAARPTKPANAEETGPWLGFELRGYPANDPISVKYMALTKRLMGPAKNLGWMPLAELGGNKSAMKAHLQSPRRSDVNVSLSNSNVDEHVEK